MPARPRLKKITESTSSGPSTTCQYSAQPFSASSMRSSAKVPMTGPAVLAMPPRLTMNMGSPDCCQLTRRGRCRHAAEEHHEHEIARLLPAHEAGRDVVGMVRVERAGEAAHRAGDDESGEAVRVRRNPDRARTRVVGFRRAQHDPESGIDNSINQKNRAQ